ncbi:MAG: ABC transporter permease subunit, partial [Cypionkella sp.]
MSKTSHAPAAQNAPMGPIARLLHATEINTRLLGMIGALLLIWGGFHIYGAVFNNGGAFLTPRNLWNLSVQTSSIGIMATGMVLVIVTRNIDLSVGSIIGVTGMAMGILQVELLPQIVGLGHWSIWIVTVLAGLAVGAAIGALHGWLIAYRGIPSFIVTLGGLMVWRGMAFLSAGGKTIAPVDANFALLGGG